MGTITFVAPGYSRTVHIAAADLGRPRTLLAIARANGIPVLFTCEAGGCGACIVRVHVSRTGESSPLTFEERYFLAAAGKLTDALESGSSCVGSRFRLACQYVVGDEDVVVDFTNQLGSV